VILDTLGRLEQVKPELKTEMLRELAEADAATAAAVVKKWRTKLAELPAPTEKVRTAVHEGKLPDHSTTDSTASGKAASQPNPATAPQPSHQASQPKPLAATQTHTGNNSPLDQKPPAAATSTSTSRVLVLEAAPDGDVPEPPNWNELLDWLLSQTHERADGIGPDATRARVQAALLELVRQSESRSQGLTTDPQLWHHLTPALEYCLGNGDGDEHSGEQVIRSLQVATELVRGPGRFQARGLAFCKRIRGFGNIDRVEVNTFGPGQPVLLYCEVEHFFSEPAPSGFRTRISTTLEVLDAGGRVLWKQEIAAVEDESSEPRRDYFLTHRFRLPTELKPGVYSVRLTLRDELANRNTSSGIALTVR